MKARPEPVRTCVACRQEAEKGTLLRLVRTPAGLISPDLSGRQPGRGAYLHPSPQCLDLARRRRSLERSLRAQLPAGFWTMVSQIRPFGDNH